MVSLLRTGITVDTLVAALENVLEPARPISVSTSPVGTTNANTVKQPIKPFMSCESLGISASIVRALVSLAALDVGLVQNMPPHSQVRDVYCLTIIMVLFLCV